MLKPVPDKLTLPPTSPAAGVRAVSVGGGGGLLVVVPGAKPTGAPGGAVARATIAVVLVPVPRSGFTTVTVTGVRDTPSATSTTATICTGDVNSTDLVVMPVPPNITLRGEFPGGSNPVPLMITVWPLTLTRSGFALSRFVDKTCGADVTMNAPDSVKVTPF